MIIAKSIAERDAVLNAVLYESLSDDRWRVYVFGDEIPNFALNAKTTYRCTGVQFEIALQKLGLRDVVFDYAKRGNAELLIHLNKATEIHSDHPLIVAGAVALGLTQQQVDNVFELALTIS